MIFDECPIFGTKLSNYMSSLKSGRISFRAESSGPPIVDLRRKLPLFFISSSFVLSIAKSSC